jgi:hypothetical protein
LKTEHAFDPEIGTSSSFKSTVSHLCSNSDEDQDLFINENYFFMGWSPMKGSMAGMNGIRCPAKRFSSGSGGWLNLLPGLDFLSILLMLRKSDRPESRLKCADQSLPLPEVLDEK